MITSEIRKVLLTGWRNVQALIAAKRRRQMLCWMLVVLLLGPSAQAKRNTGDWQVVENLEPGKHVIVKAQRKYVRIFEGRTEEELTCWVHQRRFLHPISIAIPRAEVREVRALPNQAKDAWIGAGIGAGAGAIAAGVNSKAYSGVNAFFGGLAGAGGGALVGAIFPIFDYLVRHGKCIYRG